MENVEGFEIGLDRGLIVIRFTDLFGDGEEIVLTPEDAEKVRDGLNQMIALAFSV